MDFMEWHKWEEVYITDRGWVYILAIRVSVQAYNLSSIEKSLKFFFIIVLFSIKMSFCVFEMDYRYTRFLLFFFSKYMSGLVVHFGNKAERREDPESKKGTDKEEKELLPSPAERTSCNILFVSQQKKHFLWMVHLDKTTLTPNNWENRVIKVSL